MKQTVNSIVTEFVVDLNGPLSQVVADIDSGGNIKVLYVRGDDLISQEQDSNWYFHSYDGHASTISLTNDQGEQEKFYEYDAWAALAPDDGIPRPLRQALDRVNRQIDQIIDAAKLKTPKKLA